MSQQPDIDFDNFIVILQFNVQSRAHQASHFLLWTVFIASDIEWNLNLECQALSALDSVPTYNRMINELHTTN